MEQQWLYICGVPFFSAYDTIIVFILLFLVLFCLLNQFINLSSHFYCTRRRMWQELLNDVSSFLTWAPSKTSTSTFDSVVYQVKCVLSYVKLYFHVAHFSHFFLVKFLLIFFFCALCEEIESKIISCGSHEIRK